MILISSIAISCLETRKANPITFLVTNFYFHALEDHWCVQTKERGTLRTFESEVVEVVPQDILAMLFWKKLPCPEPGSFASILYLKNGPKTFSVRLIHFRAG